MSRPMLLIRLFHFLNLLCLNLVLGFHLILFFFSNFFSVGSYSYRYPQPNSLFIFIQCLNQSKRTLKNSSFYNTTCEKTDRLFVRLQNKIVSLRMSEIRPRKERFVCERCPPICYVTQK